jgi:hypothetical protein
MSAGAYTVQVSGVGGATGTVIAELYDGTPASNFVVSTPRLVNVSVLMQINAGEILTAGFVIAGSTAKTVLIRAVGPTLGTAPFNVPGVMADPKLDLFSGQTVINSNNDWGGGATLSVAFASVGAFALRRSADGVRAKRATRGGLRQRASPTGSGRNVQREACETRVRMLSSCLYHDLGVRESGADASAFRS